LIQLKSGEASPIAPYLESIVETAEQAADITRQLLAYSGKGRFEVTKIDLNDLIQKNMKLLQATLPKNIALSFEPMAQLPLTEGDAGQVQQVIMNLIINAADAYCGRPGAVQLKTTTLNMNPDETGQWDHFGFVVLPGAYICLSVVDSGQGMEEKTLARIFDPFFTTKETGRGLGLAAVQGIIRGHRGALKVFSEPERGTRFQVLFPVSRSQTPADNLPVIQTAGSADNLILVVDDEEAIREAVYEALTFFGYRVLLAENGQAAVHLCETHPEEINLILLDMTMPVLSGSETLAMIRRKGISLPVVMMSGYDEDELDPNQDRSNVVGFLKKPFKIERLMDKIGPALAGVRREMSP
jgi:CheY-like chemotaxis protein